MRYRSIPAFKVGRWGLASAVLFVTGCTGLTGQGWGFRQPAEQTPPRELAGGVQERYVNPYVENPPAVAERPEEADEIAQQQVDEVRSQVLAFVNRFNDAGSTSEPSKSHPTGEAEAPEQEAADSPSEHARHTATDEGTATAQATPAQSALPEATESGDAESPVETVTTPSAPRVLDVSIQNATETPVARDAAESNEEADSAPAVNTPLVAQGTLSHNDGIDRLIDQLAAEVDASPSSAEAHWRLALLRLATGQEKRATESFGRLNEKSAVLLEHAVRTVGATQRAIRDPATAIDEMLHEVDALRATLKDRASLAIPTVALCSRVRAFGAYEELPEGALTPYNQKQGIVYFEVQNFSSVATADGRYRMLLSSRLEVMTPDGRVLWEHEVREIEDIARRRREDFFVAQRITLPATLSSGSYVLKVTVEDLLADKAAQAVHHFTVSTPGAP